IAACEHVLAVEPNVSDGCQPVKSQSDWTAYLLPAVPKGVIEIQAVPEILGIDAASDPIQTECAGFLQGRRHRPQSGYRLPIKAPRRLRVGGRAGGRRGQLPARHQKLAAMARDAAESAAHDSSSVAGKLGDRRL